MSIIVKENIEPHSVVVDTNVLFDQEKANVVNPEFDDFWARHSDEANLLLVLPEVVIGEILFQQTTSALKTLSKANESFCRLSGITGKSYSHRVSEKRVKKEVKDRFYSWAKSKGYEELQTPVGSIDWRTIVDASIWRKPPFTFDPKKEELEKGFRDALILETIVEFCGQEMGCKIVFISNDKLLRETVEGRLQSDVTFSVFETLDDFEAYLRLEKENLEQVFIKSVISKASDKFFTFKNESTLVYKEDLAAVIKKKYPDKFGDPSVLISSDFEDGFYSGGEWKPVSRGLFTISNRPQFQEIENENTFIWLSKVSYNQEYERGQEWDDELFRYNHEVLFDVKWKANISVNERFTKMVLLDVEYKDSSFSPMDS